MIGLGIALASCNSSDLPGYKKTENGLYYKFEVENKTAPQPKIGDVLEAEFEVKIKDSVLYSNIGHPQRSFMVEKSMFKGDLNEGLLLMHVGDKISLGISADSMSKFIPLPENFEKNKGEKIFFNITLKSIISKEDMEKERADYEAKIMAAKNSEADSIAAYVAKNNIKVKPTASGLYIVSVKKGNGAKAEKGKKVKVNYTGRFLNGKVFDTSLEPIAKEAGIHNPARPYMPMEYVFGEQSFIPGWDEATLQMRAGDIIEVVIPSSMGYGEHGSQAIPPYTPLVFKIEMISVE